MAAYAFCVFAFFFACCPPRVDGSFQFKSSRVTSGLVSLYTFEEGALNPSAVQSADQSGLNVLGNITIAHSATSATWTSGRAGLHLNGTGSLSRAVSAFNLTGLSKLLQVSQAVTIELWFTPSSATESGTIVGFGNWAARAQEPGGCGGTGYDLVMQQAGSMMKFFMLTNRSAGQCAQYGQTFTPSSVNYYAVTVNATASHTYLNSAAGTRSVVTGVAFSTWNNPMYLMFGQPVFNLGSSYTAYTWEGDIYLLSVYTRALNQSEIQQNYNAGVPFSTPVGLPAVSWIAIQQGTIASLPVLNYTNYDSSKYSSVNLVITSMPTAGTLQTSAGIMVTYVPFAFQSGQIFVYHGNPGFSGIDSVAFAPNNSYGLGTSGSVNILAIAPAYSSNMTITVPMMATSQCSCQLSCAQLLVP